MAGRSGGPGQRERLVEAMTIVAARHGYAGASVARVIKQAGMSRATFYECFEDRDDCFLAAYRMAADGLKQVLKNAAGAAGAPERPREVLAQMLAAADSDPAATRLVLLEALAGDDTVRGEHEELLALIVAATERYLADGPAGRQTFEIPVRALLGGIGNVIATRIFRHEGGRLGELHDDLLAWLGSYALPAGRSRLSAEDWAELGRVWCQTREEPPSPTAGSGTLPRGKSALSPAQVASEHRQRIIDGIASCAREKGYARMTVADIVSRAGITRAAFYEQFRSKEDAFLAAQSYSLEASAALAAAKFFTGTMWQERVWSAGAALIGFFASHPDLVALHELESYRAGPAAIRRGYEARMAYTVFVEEGYRQRPEAEGLPRICSEAIAGAIEELLRDCAARDATERAQELVPQAVYVILAPFIGVEEALDFVRERCRAGA